MYDVYNIFSNSTEKKLYVGVCGGNAEGDKEKKSEKGRDRR